MLAVLPESAGSSENFPKDESQKLYLINVLSTRAHTIWPRISLSAMCYEGILKVEHLRGNFIGLPSRKKTWYVRPLIHSRSSPGKNFRMYLCKAHVMPSFTVTLEDKQSSLEISI